MAAKKGWYRNEPLLVKQRCQGPCGLFKLGVTRDPETSLELCPDCRFPQRRNGHLAQPSNGHRIFHQPKLPSEKTIE